MKPQQLLTPAELDEMEAACMGQWALIGTEASFHLTVDARLIASHRTALAQLAEAEGERDRLRALVNAASEPNLALQEAARQYRRATYRGPITEIINKHINASDHNMFGVAVRSADDILALFDARAALNPTAEGE